MTYTEYTKKKNAIATSEAPVSDKVVAMKKLDKQFYRKPKEEAMKQIIESAPEPPELGDE